MSKRHIGILAILVAGVILGVSAGAPDLHPASQIARRVRGSPQFTIGGSS